MVNKISIFIISYGLNISFGDILAQMLIEVYRCKYSFWKFESLIRYQIFAIILYWNMFKSVGINTDWLWQVTNEYMKELQICNATLGIKTLITLSGHVAIFFKRTLWRRLNTLKLSFRGDLRKLRHRLYNSVSIWTFKMVKMNWETKWELHQTFGSEKMFQSQTLLILN